MRVHIERQRTTQRMARTYLVAAKGDLKNFNSRYVERIRLKGDVPLLKTEVIREAIYRDCRKPAFRTKLWDAAREFEARVFAPYSESLNFGSW